MEKRYQGAFWKKNRYRKQAGQWFDSTNDTQPFDAFGTEENKKRIAEEIFSHIYHDIHAKRNTSYSLIRIAATVLVFFTIGIATYYFAYLRPAQNQIAWSEFKSLSGHLDEVLLPDSSVVYLRPGSVLKVPQEFKGHNREVLLIEGEAFFNVKHDRQHPFIVQSSNLRTQVLGTSFIIKNYHKLKIIQVSVTTGKVSVMNGKTLLGFLTPQQQLTFDRASKKTSYEVTGTELAETWKNGEYALKNASIQELALTLENVYGFKVTLKSEALQKTSTTIRFNMKDKIQGVLEQLKLIHNVKYIIKNKEVILMK